MKNFKLGFTLAEVLITLAIIGVVAALTLPTLVNNYKEKEAITRLKKSYATINQAYHLALAENGPFTEWFEGVETNSQAAEIFYKNFSKHLNVAKYCGGKPGCFTQGYLKSLSGIDYAKYDDFTNEYKLTLQDGTAIMFYIENRNCKLNDFCGNIKVDVNGRDKGPYAWGKDVFVFNLYPNDIAPAGKVNDPASFSSYCNMNSQSRENGISCTAWVLENENMDYLRCDDLSWEGKRSCSK